MELYMLDLTNPIHDELVVQLMALRKEEDFERLFSVINQAVTNMLEDKTKGRFRVAGVLLHEASHSIHGFDSMRTQECREKVRKLTEHYLHALSLEDWAEAVDTRILLSTRRKPKDVENG